VWLRNDIGRVDYYQRRPRQDIANNIMLCEFYLLPTFYSDSSFWIK